MKQKRMIILIFIAAVFGISAYFLYFQNKYSGTFDFIVNGQEYSMELTELNRVKGPDGTLYSAVFSDRGNEMKLSFKVWKEDNEAQISLDNPRIHLDGENYIMLHPLRNNDYSVEALLDNYIWITFLNPQMSNHYHLNGRLIIDGG